jgi:hypothetical protein
VWISVFLILINGRGMVMHRLSDLAATVAQMISLIKQLPDTPFDLFDGGFVFCPVFSPFAAIPRSSFRSRPSCSAQPPS